MCVLVCRMAYALIKTHRNTLAHHMKMHQPIAEFSCKIFVDEILKFEFGG